MNKLLSIKNEIFINYPKCTFNVIIIIIINRDGIFLCCSGWSAVAQSWLTSISTSQVQGILLPQPPEYLRLQVCATMPSHFFVLLVEMGFCYVCEAGLKLLASSDPSNLASQSAGITGWCYHVRPFSTFCLRHL